MVEHLTLARPYAQAIFKVAQEKKSLSQWADMLGSLSLVVQDPSAQAFLSSPDLSKNEQTAWFLSFFNHVDHGSKEDLSSFLNVLVDQKRWSVLPQISEVYEELLNEAEGVLPVSLQTAYPMDERAQLDLAEVLSKKYGKKVIITEVQEVSELISGVRIFVGDQMIDASVRGRLQDMAARLKH
jgi:F-type H+-transporting ATPase subunit delta